MKSRGSTIEPRRCDATAHGTGEQCKHYAIPGTTVCRNHGGGLPLVRNAADRRVREAKVEKQMLRALTRQEIQPVDDPLRALQELAGEALVWKDLLARHVAKLKSPRYRNQFGEQLRAEVVVYERALDRAGELLAKIARLNIDERLAAIDAQKKLMVIRAIEASLASAGITGPALAEAKKVAGRHLRVIQGELADPPAA